jgi:hypothetical protein
MEGSAAMVEIDRMQLRHLERCRTCNTCLPVPPAPRVCTHCGAVKTTPLHEDWPRGVKVFLLLRYAGRNLFNPNLRTIQDSWELLLTSNYEGGRFPSGRIIKQGVSPDDVFALAVQEAEEWRLAGAATAFL